MSKTLYMSANSVNHKTTWDSFINRICFDPDKAIIFGKYKDELSCYRARNIWIELLDEHFFLQAGIDFNVEIEKESDSEFFELSCNFNTACGRYAFWRITNYQAPEVQYLMETAHIPMCESRQEEIMMTPDLCSIYEEPIAQKGLNSKNFVNNLIDKTISKIKNLAKEIDSVKD